MNIVYNASAGTGKTYQVTQLYEKLVLTDGIDPREILLMTFTDNAAAELRMRVTHRLLKARRAAEAKGNDEQAERALFASSRLPAAPIGTIHAFCAHLLREHALEAGLSPGFATLIGEERDELLAQMSRNELLAHLETDPDFKTFCSGTQMIGTAGGFGTSITETVPKLLDTANSLGIDLTHAETLLPEPLPLISISEFESILNRLQSLAKKTKKIEQAIQTLTNCIEQAADACALADQFDQKFSGHFSYGEAKAIYPEFKALKEAARDRKHYIERFPAAKAFARYVQTVCRQFQHRKHEMNAVDFDDQLRLAEQLLQRGKATPEYRYVIVDEVQDTSRLQCNIIQSLWRTETNLIICGDKKQSIYTWRGADPQVMPDLETAIRNAGGTPEHLQTSYRSKAPVLDVVNALFASVYSAEDYSETDHLQTNPEFATGGEKACVEFLAPDSEENDLSKREKVAAEMEAVANRIRLLIEGGENWTPHYRHAASGFEPTSPDNAYRYSDILILLRRTAHQPALEQALRHADIPYTLGGKGRGLFSRSETRDISLFLNVVTNPKDALSLIGFLRSPWIGLSDEAIAELAWSEDGFSAEHLLTRHTEATDMVNRYRKLLGTKLASELVRQLIDETAYDALLAGLPRGEQRLANLRKVIDWLRETEHGAQTTPASVARKLARYIAEPPKIPEAALLNPAQNAVTIMTVHGSKGLTKRVVFIPDLSVSSQPDRSFAQLFSDEDQTPRLGLRITAPDRSSVKSPGFETASALAKAVREHESNNLFYVAMTRAQDLVITSASPGKKTAGWLAQMEAFIGREIPLVPYSALSSAPPKLQTPNPKLPTTNALAAALGTLLPPPAPPSLLRIPATRFAKEQDEIEETLFDTEAQPVRTTSTSSAMGSLGHAVLEQLALNQWKGSVDEWLEKLRDDFGIGKQKAATLRSRIEQTRTQMIELTANAESMRPEFPFVLHHEERIIDGTIDLLCQRGDVGMIFDYKFTETPAARVAEQYRKQMEVYWTAVAKCFPRLGEITTTLLLISSSGARPITVDL